MTDTLVFSYYNVILGSIAILFLLLLWRIVVKYRRKKRNKKILDNYIQYSLFTPAQKASSKDTEKTKEKVNL